jgi:hypothetical protein
MIRRLRGAESQVKKHEKLRLDNVLRLVLYAAMLSACWSVADLLLLFEMQCVCLQGCFTGVYL